MESVLRSSSRLDREPLPRDYWYVACAAAELGQTPVARRVHNQPLVLFRGQDGAPVVLHDRCPHRGVALSLGHIQGDHIACAYHGWRFGPDGACTHIPSFATGRDIAAGVGVRRFACAERDGYVWVWPGEGEPYPAEPRPIPGFADRLWLQGALDLACEAIMPIENNLDIAHPYFTHPRVHPQWFMIEQRGFRDLAYDLISTATGLEVTTGDPGGGLRLAFDLPDRVTVAGAGPLIVMHHTPTAPGRCRQHWLFSLNTASPEAPHSVTWTDQTHAIFEQDRVVMESAQQAYETEGGVFERSVEADSATLMARRLLSAARTGRPAPTQASRTVIVRS
jgi:nitrite reductase/ring-hydroxylating ferredoxin subunit